MELFQMTGAQLVALVEDEPGSESSAGLAELMLEVRVVLGVEGQLDLFEETAGTF